MKPGDLVKYTHRVYDRREKITEMAIILSEEKHFSLDTRFFRVFTDAGQIKLCNEHYLEVVG